jgi:very-short-patch-repair endonuclease
MLQCEECEREFQDYSSLGSHIGQSHRNLTIKGYYDKYLKKDQNEGICKKTDCKKSTKFIGLTIGYNNYCSQKCATKEKDFEKIINRTKLICPYCGIKFYNTSNFLSHISHLDDNHKTIKEKIEKEKEFSKKIICKICERKFKDFRTLGIHLNQTHGDYKREFVKEYYNNYLKKDSIEGICKTCGKETKFANLSYGYYKHCNTKCSKLDPEVEKKSKQTCLKNHGVTNYAKTENWLNQMSNGGQAARMLTFIQNPSKPQKKIFDIVKNEYNDAIINFPILNYCADIAIPSIKVIIEYNGEYWHRGKEDYDLQRKDSIEKVGWKVLIYQGIKGSDFIPSREQIKNDIVSLKLNKKLIL